MNMSKLNENNRKEKQIVEGFDLILITTENIILRVFSYRRLKRAPVKF